MFDILVSSKRAVSPNRKENKKMKATFKKIRVGSKIKDILGDVLTVKEKRDGIVVATWEGSKGELWIFGDTQLKHYELIEE